MEQPQDAYAAQMAAVENLAVPELLCNSSDLAELTQAIPDPFQGHGNILSNDDRLPKQATVDTVTADDRLPEQAMEDTVRADDRLPEQAMEDAVRAGDRLPEQPTVTAARDLPNLGIGNVENGGAVFDQMQSSLYKELTNSGQADAQSSEVLGSSVQVRAKPCTASSQSVSGCAAFGSILDSTNSLCSADTDAPHAVINEAFRDTQPGARSDLQQHLAEQMAAESLDCLQKQHAAAGETNHTSTGKAQQARMVAAMHTKPKHRHGAQLRKAAAEAAAAAVAQAARAESAVRLTTPPTIAFNSRAAQHAMAAAEAAAAAAALTPWGSIDLSRLQKCHSSEIGAEPLHNVDSSETRAGHVHKLHAKQQQEGQDPFEASLLSPVCVEPCKVGSRGPLLDQTNLAGHTLQQASHRTHQHNQRSEWHRHKPYETATALALACNAAPGFQTPIQAKTVMSSAHAPSAGAIAKCAGDVDRVDAQMPAACMAAGMTADPGAGLTALTEEQFWESARADLTDTAEPVRHRSRLHGCQPEAESPTDLKWSSPVTSKHGQQLNPEPGPAQRSPYWHGITPLLGKHSRRCTNVLHQENHKKLPCVFAAFYCKQSWLHAMLGFR